MNQYYYTKERTTCTSFYYTLKEKSIIDNCKWQKQTSWLFKSTVLWHVSLVKMVSTSHASNNLSLKFNQQKQTQLVLGSRFEGRITGFQIRWTVQPLNPDYFTARHAHHTYYMPILTSFVGQKRILPLHFSVSPPQVCHSFQIYIQASLIRNSSSPPCLTHEHWELGLWIILKTKQQIKTEICWRCRLRWTAKYIDLILQLLMIFMV